MHIADIKIVISFKNVNVVLITNDFPVNVFVLKIPGYIASNVHALWSLVAESEHDERFCQVSALVIIHTSHV